MGKLKTFIASGGYLALVVSLLINTSTLNADTTYNYDVDGNGTVNVLDLIYLKTHLLNAETEQQPSSTSTTSKDYVISKDYIDAIKKVSEDDVEIEKKWLIDKEKIPYDLSKVEHHFDIEQTYICFSPEMRVRRYSNDNSYEFTVKSNMSSDGLVRDETNIAITEKEYNDLMRKKEGITIHKTRYQFLYNGDLIAIDIFHDELDGLAYMEIEFANKQDADNYKTPDWVIADVTSDVRYKNGDLARYGIPELN